MIGLTQLIHPSANPNDPVDVLRWRNFVQTGVVVLSRHIAADAHTSTF